MWVGCGCGITLLATVLVESFVGGREVLVVVLGILSVDVWVSEVIQVVHVHLP
jgi:hypothetical protein